VRFTRSKDGKTLYAIALEWPEDNTLSIAALAAVRGAAKVSSVTMLGYEGLLEWVQTSDGLLISMPENKPCENAWSFRIEI
jgi:alpha-L-fucosidase